MPTHVHHLPTPQPSAASRAHVAALVQSAGRDITASRRAGALRALARLSAPQLPQLLLEAARCPDVRLLDAVLDLTSDPAIHQRVAATLAARPPDTRPAREHLGRRLLPAARTNPVVLAHLAGFADSGTLAAAAHGHRAPTPSVFRALRARLAATSRLAPGRRHLMRALAGLVPRAPRGALSAAQSGGLTHAAPAGGLTPHEG